MDFSQFKDILKENTRYIIIENGHPSHIVIPIKEYESLVNGRPAKLINIEEDFEKINQDIAVLNDENSENLNTKTVEKQDFKEIKIEDLPF